MILRGISLGPSSVLNPSAREINPVLEKVEKCVVEF